MPRSRPRPHPATAPASPPADRPAGPAQRLTAALAPRRRGPVSLRTRLAAGVLALVLVMSALTGAASTMSLRHSLMDRLDSQLTAAAERAQARRHPDGARPSSPAGTQQAELGTAPTDQAAPDGTTDPTDQPGSATGPAPDSGHRRLPPGLDAAGQATGTLAVVVLSPQVAAQTGQRTVLAAYIDDTGAYQDLSTEQTDAVLSLPVSDQPVTVRLPSLGDYRVIVGQDEVTGNLVVTGLSLAGDQALVRRQLLLEAVIALAGAVLAAWAGRAIVRRHLAPLERVADTARQVASQPLERGEVTISQRVSQEDLASSTEVREVGRALNTLLAHVDDALSVRQRSEEQVRQFVADASHELRTPLASIRGYTELVQRQLRQPDQPAPPDQDGAHAAPPADPWQQTAETTHALERVHSEAVRMTGLVEDLLLLARLDAGRELRHEEVDLLALAADAVADAQVASPDHDWDLDLSALLDPPGTDGTDGTDDADGTDTDDAARGQVGASRPDQREEDEDDDGPRLPVVIGDEARLRQVLANLLTNAAVHTPAGTHVSVRLRPQADAWVIEVADDGPGIPPGLRERVFERFARGDAARERVHAASPSTGLGTSIALAIVRSHGGTLTLSSRIAAESAHPGTTFTVRLPQAAGEGVASSGA